METIFIFTSKRLLLFFFLLFFDKNQVMLPGGFTFSGYFLPIVSPSLSSLMHLFLEMSDYL